MASVDTPTHVRKKKSPSPAANGGHMGKTNSANRANRKHAITGKDALVSSVSPVADFILEYRHKTKLGTKS